MTKMRKVLWITAGVLFLIPAVIFFFYDLEISKAIVQDNPNFLFRILDAVGEFPIYIAPVLFGLVFGFCSENKYLKTVFHMIGLIAIYICLVRLTGGIFEQFYNSELSLLQYILLPIASLLIYILLVILVAKINLQKLYNIKDLTLIGVILSISSFIIVTAIKYIWGRPRFMYLDDQYLDYSNYLTIHGFSNSLLGNRNLSFPSGHTNSASCIIVLLLIFKRLTNKKWVHMLIGIGCYGYILLVALSRVCIGAHYASDVLFAFGINSLCLITIYGIFKKKGWLHVRGNKC